MRRGVALAVFALAVVSAAFFAGSSVAASRADCTPDVCVVALQSPANGSTIAYSSGMTVNFTWNINFYCGDPDQSQCAYDFPVEVKITTDSSLQNVVQDKYAGFCTPNCPQSWTSLPFTQPGTYYWQVTTRGGSNVNPVSSVWSFTLQQQSGGGGGGGGPSSQTYTDTSGDSHVGYDIRSVTVSNDNQPSLHFAVSVPSQSALGGNERIVIWFDTDSNSSTGQNGWDVEICTCSNANNTQLILYTYSGSAFTKATNQPASARMSYAGGWSIDFLAREIGLPSTFRFALESFQRANGSDTTDDRAPDSGSWTYTIGTSGGGGGGGGGGGSAGKPHVRGVYYTSTGPIAGHDFAVSLDVTNTKTKQVYRGGAVSCRGTFGTTRVTAVSRGFDKGASLYRCWWHIPFSAVGKRFVGKTTVTFSTGSVSGSYSHIVKQTPSVLVFPNPLQKLTSLTAGKPFVVNLSARLSDPDGLFHYINWHQKGTSAACVAHVAGGGTITGAVSKSVTGVQCNWSIPYSAKGKQISFAITVKALGQSKTMRFTGRAG